jgi:hypothetical protein
MAAYGNNKIDFLRKFSAYNRSIPSATMIMRVFSLLDKRKFEALLPKWADELLNTHLLALMHGLPEKNSRQNS